MTQDDLTSGVTYTVRELFERLESRLEEIIRKLDLKASQESVDHLDKRLTDVERDVIGLKQSRAQILAIAGAVTFIVPLATAAILNYL